jgi:hypothetical protein
VYETDVFFCVVGRTALAHVSDAVDDGVHPSDRVDLISDASGVGSATPVADDHASRP